VKYNNLLSFKGASIKKIDNKLHWYAYDKYYNNFAMSDYNQNNIMDFRCYREPPRKNNNDDVIFLEDKFYQDAVEDKFFTDADIWLSDHKGTLAVKVHRCVLGLSSEYFHKIFNSNQCWHQVTFKIEVNNRKIARDVIFSYFYNQKMNSTLYHKNKNIFGMFKCKTLFGLKNDVKLLYDIKVLPEEFDLFVEIIKNIGLISDEHLIKTVKENIPLNYDLSNPAAEFINKFIDTIKIILIDSQGTLSIIAHKCILEKSPYFYALLHFNENTSCRAGQEKHFEVDNKNIAHDVILTLYDQSSRTHSTMHKDIKYLSEMFKCRNLFCLDNNIRLLYDMDIAKEDFDLFIQVINLFAQVNENFDLVNDKHLMRTIKKNIPPDYDLNNFTIEFINELILLTDYKIISASNNIGSQLLNTLIGHGVIRDVAFSYPEPIDVKLREYVHFKTK
jgi:hypothetical protein